MLLVKFADQKQFSHCSGFECSLNPFSDVGFVKTINEIVS